MMDKSNHTVTVPREYLEQLEEFYNKHGMEKAHEENIVGRLAKYGFSDVLLLKHNKHANPSVDGIVVIDEEGKELRTFIPKNLV